MTKCKKHPKYRGKNYPAIDCKWCLYVWTFKRGAERIMDKVDREYMEQLKKRLDPPCDARAYAERHDFGGSDAGGRSRG